MNKKLLIFFVISFIAFNFFSCSSGLKSEEANKKPNILLIVADDLGYSDLGSFGSEIETPNIDAIAYEGIRFSKFYASPLCAPTRAMLLSGNDNHIAGMGSMFERTENFGCEKRLTNRVAIIPELLKTQNYHTYMAGKWHLGTDPEANPFNRGFDQSFVNLLGAGNHYNDKGLFAENRITPYTENGKPAKWKDGNYSTDFYTDKLIEFIDSNLDDDNPFFAFAAYTSPHWPLQVDLKYSQKYQGYYDDGYEKLKEKRFLNLKRIGMIPKDSEMPPNHEDIKSWDLLSDEEKKSEAKKMELYAGMVDNLDFNIGRLIKYLKKIGEYENTFIVFMSDNGAAPADLYNNPKYSEYIREYFNNDFDNMGNLNSFVSYGPQWAEASSAPFKFYKGLTTEGGVRAPMIITGPNINRENEIHHASLTLMDIAPTFYEMANINYPKTYNESELYPLKGNSILTYLSKKSNQIKESEFVFELEHNKKAMLIRGDWKITNITEPFNESNFKLYNLAHDQAEMNDVKSLNPEIYNELLKEWKKFSNEVHLDLE